MNVTENTMFEQHLNSEFYPNTLIKMVSVDDTETLLSYSTLINHLFASKAKSFENIERLEIYTKGDNLEKLLCGIAPLWKEHESKELFEKYYRLSEMMRCLYCNQFEEDTGEPAYIFLDIENEPEKLIATWQGKLVGHDEENNELYEDSFSYRPATIEERGILDLIQDIVKVELPEKFIVVHEDNITLGGCKNLYSHIAAIGFPPHIVNINAE